MEPQTNNSEPAEAQNQSAGSGAPETPAAQAASEAQPGTDTTPASDMSQYRSFAILGYILPFLFFLPLLDDKTKEVPYVRFHANQQLILLIMAFGVYIIHNVLYITIMFSYLMLAQLLNLGLLIFAIIGIYNAYNGKMKELPFVGQFKILK